MKATALYAISRAIACWEGGMSNDPTDQGGFTKFGLASRWHDLSHVNSVEDAVQVYLAEYWNHKYLQLDLLEPQDIAVKVFDLAVYSGPKAAAIILQRALNLMSASLKVDGKIGPITRSAAESRQLKGLLLGIGSEAAVYHLSLSGGSNDKYIEGWIRRDHVMPEPVVSGF